jgi:hypothetical protein
MINDTSNKVEFFEAGGVKYKFTILTEFNSDSVRLIQTLWESYSGNRLKQNYTPEVLKRMVQSQRFDLGFFIVERDNDVVASFGLTLYNNWAVGTRYIKHTKKIEPIAATVIAPFLKSFLNGKVDGMAVAYNSDERRTLSVFSEKADRVFVYKNLSDSDLKHLYEFKELEYEVFYRNTRQRVFYAPYKEGAKPVFERYTGSNDRNHPS